MFDIFYSVNPVS